MLLEFSSARPPGPPAAGRRWPRSYWPGGATVAIGVALVLGGGSGANLLGQLVGVLGCCLLANTAVTRRLVAADANREPRRWAIDDDGLRSGNRLGSVHWTWAQVHRAVEYPDRYLLYQSDNPHTATFDVPREPLTPDQDDEFRAFLTDRGLLPAT
ncbi:YcxB family protein [Actinoplanes sp. KI2]|uniref:YcxB family protein n=1 Tax=Actinoplanes sp. KI2 TaxID=2983315 RepID=UPI0021D5FB1D|nr:YcxB family protein [Actinoplanes sp. KI2]MCU7729072.1 YcxB family protein [Actinoplanes sp. KI2]